MTGDHCPEDQKGQSLRDQSIKGRNVPKALCSSIFLFHVAGRSSRRILVNSRFTRGELLRCIGIPLKKMALCYPGNEHVRNDVANTAGAHGPVATAEANRGS